MKNNKGITLIVLIITVIIMLILVAVVIDITIDNQLINNAKNAVDQTNDKVGRTQNRVDELMGELDRVKENSPEEETEECEHLFNTEECTKCGMPIEEIFTTAQKHPDQTESEDIGIAEDGTPVNLDLWAYWDSYNAGGWELGQYIGSWYDERLQRKLY